MMSTNSEICLLLEIGSLDYQKALEVQRILHRKVVDGSLPNLIMILQHPHVFTQGRRGKPEHILTSCNELRKLGIKVHYVDRGGEATYHGPGQIICYPIMNIKHWGVRKYVSILEKIIIDSLSVYGISGVVRRNTVGVWVGDAKIAALGLKISAGVSMHGFALNVSPDLSYFGRIVPCGSPGAKVTSIDAELKCSAARPANDLEVQAVLIDALRGELGLDLEQKTLVELGL